MIDQSPGLFFDVGFAQRDDFATEHVKPSLDADDTVARDRRIRVVVCHGVQAIRVRIADPGAFALLHQQIVFEALADHETDFGTGLAEQGIQHDGTGVDDDVACAERLVEVASGGVGSVSDRAEETLRFVLFVGQVLADQKLPLLVDDDGVRQGAAGVERYPVGAFAGAWPSRSHISCSSMVVPRSCDPAGLFLYWMRIPGVTVRVRSSCLVQMIRAIKLIHCYRRDRAR